MLSFQAILLTDFLGPSKENGFSLKTNEAYQSPGGLPVLPKGPQNKRKLILVFQTTKLVLCHLLNL